MPDLLDSFGKKEKRDFARDFKQMIRVAVGMNKYYGWCKEDITKYRKEYDKLIEMFNKKYKGIFMKLAAKADGLELKVFFRKETDMKGVFSNASKIIGIKAIGLEGFGEVDVGSPELQETLSRAKEQLYISYYDAESGSSTILIEFSKKEKMVELIYDIEGMENEKSPEFKLCIFYGIKEGYEPGIDIIGEEAKFGFIDYLEAEEKNAKMRDFCPKFTE